MSGLHSMKQRTIAEALTEAERHAAGNRREIERSRYAGCFSCCATFNVTQIVDWNDEWTTSEKRNEANRWTSKCPRCGEATVIGSSTGLLDDQAYLPVISEFRALKATE